jgi:hypothetical protein
MMLLHLEMQLRQQALSSYQEAQDPLRRIQRLDEVLALNEQLNEVGGILSGLLSTPLSRLSNNDESELSGSLSEMGASLRRGLINRPSVIQGLNDPELLQRAGASMRDGLRRLRTPVNDDAGNTPRPNVSQDEQPREAESTTRPRRVVETPSESPTPPSTPREHILLSRAREPTRSLQPQGAAPTRPTRAPEPPPLTRSEPEPSPSSRVTLPPITPQQSEPATSPVLQEAVTPRVIPEGSGALQRAMRDVRPPNTQRISASLTHSNSSNRVQAERDAPRHSRPLSRISSSIPENRPPDDAKTTAERHVVTRLLPSRSSSNHRPTQRTSVGNSRVLNQSRSSTRPTLVPQSLPASQRSSRTSSNSQRASRTSESPQQPSRGTPLLRARRRSEIQEQIRYGRRESDN